MTAARWALVGEDVALARFVHPDAVTQLVQLPGPSAAGVAGRLEALYTALRQQHVEYAHAPPSDEAGRQVIRPPEQVLWAPRHGTCLDLALLLAGAGLAAGLHPIVIVLGGSGGIGHAVVGFWTGLDSDYPDTTTPGWWPQAPAGFDDLLQTSLTGAGSLLVVDPVGYAHPLPGASVAGANVGLAEAVTNGTHYVRTRPWHTAVDIKRHWRALDEHSLTARPAQEPLRVPYVDPGTAESPLQLVRAEYGIVAFHNRDEYTIATDFCHTSAQSDITGLLVLSGAGGSGKTRLALELAHTLRRQGWYTGLLRPQAAESDVAWLGRVVSPTLVVVDYADAHLADALRVLTAVRRRPGPPAVVVLTARSTDGTWLEQIATSARDDGHLLRQRILALPDHHPHGPAVFRRAYQALATPDTSRLPNESVLATLAPQRWTTLDYVLLGWFAARIGPTLPDTPEHLYNEVLQHEVSYWRRTWNRTRRDIEAPTDLFRTAAAYLSLTTPEPTDIDAALQILEQVPADWRYDLGRTLTTCLQPRAGERLALRPDPIADHLILTELTNRPAALTSWLGPLPDHQRASPVAVLNRAGQRDPDTVHTLLTGLLRAGPDWWQPMLSVAADQSGPALTALTAAVTDPATTLPLDALSQSIPHVRVGLVSLGLHIDQTRLTHARADDTTTPQRLAELLLIVSSRHDAVGGRAAALTSITEATDLYRELVAANPARFLPDLAGSLNNLSVRQSDAGDRAAALTSITEATDLYRELVAANPAAFLPDLAMSLNNLSLRQSDAGDRAAALTSITEATDLYRQLATANPARFLPDLATSLNNLSNRQSDTGDRAAALTSITEAVTIRRELATANPAAFLPNLANSSAALADVHQAAGRHDAAEAVWIEAIAAMTSASATAQLSAHFAIWLHRSGSPHLAVDRLVDAASQASDNRSRQTVRQAVSATATVDARLPVWATADLSVDDVDLLNAWGSLDTWPTVERFLREHTEQLTSTLPATLALLADLHPGHPMVERQRATLAAINEHGLDAYLAAGRTAYERAQLIDAWVATATWEESATFLQQHRDQLMHPDVAGHLATIDHPVARQHAAILTLAAAHSSGWLYQLVTDPVAADDAALDAVQTGDVGRLRLITDAQPALADDPLVAITLNLHNGDIDQSTRIARTVAATNGDNQRHALVIRLKGHARHHPDLADTIDTLANIIAA